MNLTKYITLPSIVFLLLGLFSFNFWGQTKSFEVISGGIALISLFFLNNKRLFALPILFLLFFTIMSVFSCYIFRHQSFLDSAIALRFFLLIYLYFLIIDRDIPEITLEMVVNVLFYGYIFWYFVKLMSNGSILIDADEYKQAIPGFITAPFVFFQYINKFFIKKDWRYFFPIILSFSMIVAINSRTMLLAVVISVLFLIRMYYKDYGAFKYILIFGVVGILLFQLPVFRDILNNLLEKQKESNLSNDDYIRVLQWNYFTNEHFHSIWEWLFGSGVPATNSEYGNYMLPKGSIGGVKTGYFDWGIIGLSWVMGIFSVLCIVWYSVKGIFTKLAPRFYYLNVLFVFLLFSSLFWNILYQQGSFYIQAIILAMIEQNHKKYVIIRNFCNNSNL